ncbi:MAG TPA: hypothetical protein VFL98_03285 [Candidatus Paceibacterota bacterium]|nr:hypothetical protein [Candidatus Paceibacterota bacterium]
MAAGRITLMIGIACIAALAGYASWYSYHRYAVIRAREACEYQLAHPQTARAPDGTQVPVYALCPFSITPPPLSDLLRGTVVFTGIPDRMQVNPYTLWDVLLGRYSVSPARLPSCDQSATTTDCAALLRMHGLTPANP